MQTTAPIRPALKKIRNSDIALINLARRTGYRWSTTTTLWYPRGANRPKKKLLGVKYKKESVNNLDTHSNQHKRFIDDSLNFKYVDMTY